MGDLILLTIVKQAYLISWMPLPHTPRVRVKAWRVYSSDLMLSRVPPGGVDATVAPPDGTGLSRVSWRFSEDVTCVLRTPWPRAPDWAYDIAIPIPTKPYQNFVYRIAVRLGLERVAQRFAPASSGATGREYSVNLLLAVNDLTASLAKSGG